MECPGPKQVEQAPVSALCPQSRPRPCPGLWPSRRSLLSHCEPGLTPLSGTSRGFCYTSSTGSHLVPASDPYLEPLSSHIQTELPLLSRAASQLPTGSREGQSSPGSLLPQLPRLFTLIQWTLTNLTCWFFRNITLLTLNALIYLWSLVAHRNQSLSYSQWCSESSAAYDN